MTSLFAVVSALMLRQIAPKPGPVTLSLDNIIEGLEKNQEIWRAQKNWMVRYTNSRERIDPPPGTYASYGDNQVINARKGAWAFLSENQATGGGADLPSGRQTWALWKEKQYTERNQLNVTIRDGDPGAGNLFFNVWLYPMGLCRDSLSDTFSIPEEAYREPEGLWTELPRCLKSYRAHYRVRHQTEDVDGFPCHVVEWAGKDVVWIDPRHGFNFRRRRGFQPSGNLLYEVKASYFKEKTPGIWLPERQISLTYNMDRDPKSYHGRVAYIMINALQEARFNDVPDGVFEVPLTKEVRILDVRKRD
jgi:hypothetical protein